MRSSRIIFFRRGREQCKPNLISWSTFSKEKKHGGLGLGGIANRNMALLVNGIGDFLKNMIRVGPRLSEANMGVP